MGKNLKRKNKKAIRKAFNAARRQNFYNFRSAMSLRRLWFKRGLKQHKGRRGAWIMKGYAKRKSDTYKRARIASAKGEYRL